MQVYPKISYHNKEEYVTLKGFATIYKEESEVQLTDKLASSTTTLLTMTVPNCGDRQYFGFLETDIAELIYVQPNTVVKITFGDADDDDQ